MNIWKTRYKYITLQQQTFTETIISMKTFELNSLGTITSYEDFRGWWKSNKTFVPLLQKELAFNFMNLIPKQDQQFLENAELAIRNFLNLKEENRIELEKQLHEYLEESNSLSDFEISSIWEAIHPYKVFVNQRSKDQKDVIIRVSCECDWEEEDGLQLFFTNGNTLTKICSQDGYLVESDTFSYADWDGHHFAELE